MSWFETLPDKCPPNDAYSPREEVFYRVCGTNPPVSDDFVSKRSENPEMKFKLDECICRAVSLWMSKERCDDLLKLPTNAGKVVCAISLKSNDGLLKSTLGKGHYSWWRSNNFDCKRAFIKNSSE